jgi:hypothetical protein
VNEYTALETAVLRMLITSAESNGNDFGLTEDARPACSSKKQLGGVIASLVKKGVIIVHGTENGWTQFTWPEVPGTGERIVATLETTTKEG